MSRKWISYYCIVFIIYFIIYGCNENIIDENGFITNTNYIATESLSQEINITNQSKLRLEGISGDISIVGRSDISTIKIESEKKIGSESIEDAAAHLPDLNVFISNSEDEIFVKTYQPQQSYGRSYILEYRVIVPNNFAVLIGNTNGIIMVDSIYKNVNINNVNGAVILNDLNGSTEINLVNGQISSNQTMPTDGTISLKTVNGTIELFIPQNTSSEFIATAVNGNININNLLLRNNINHTYSIQGTLGDGRGMITLETTNGSIYVSGY